MNIAFLLLVACGAPQAVTRPCSPPSPAPSTPPSISVRALDQAGLPLPGAEVRVKCKGHLSSLKPEVERANSDGYARFWGLPPGPYEIAVELQGFKKQKRTLRLVGDPTSGPAELTVTLAIAGPMVTIE